MMQTARIMFALLKKNNTHPGMLASVLVLATMAALSVWDARSQFATEAWLALFAWLLVLAASSGAGAFGMDLKNDHIRFLEYLPVRRWHIWAANVIDGLAWLALVIVISVWHRTLTWTPGVDEDLRNPLQRAFFEGRWTLLTGCLAVSFCAFCAAAYARLAIERDSTATFRALHDSFWAVGLVVFVPAMMLLTPTFDDLALPLILVGLLHAAAGFVTFMFTPREWGRWKRWWLIRLPTLVVLLAGTLGIVLLACHRWSRLIPGEPVAVSLASPPARAATVALNLRSQRSGNHLTLCDVTGGTATYIGRNVRYAGQSGDRLLLGMLRLGRSLPQPGIVPADLDGTVHHDCFLPDEFSFEGRKWHRNTPIWSEDLSTVAFTAWGQHDTSLFVADRSGTPSRRIAVADTTTLALAGARYLLPLAPRDPEASTTRWYRDFIIYDANAGTWTELMLPAALLVCDRSMTRALCVRDESQPGGAPSYALLLVDVVSGESRDVLPASVVAPPDAENDLDRDHWSWRPTVVDETGGAIDTGSFVCAVDARLTQAAWFWRRSGRRVAGDVQWVDLKTAERRTLVTGSRLREHFGERAFGPRFDLEGFTATLDGLVVTSSREVACIDLGDATIQTMARAAAGDEYPDFMLSPQRKRVLYARRQSTSDRLDRWQREVWTQGASEAIGGSSLATQVLWRDDDHLLMAGGQAMWMIDLRSMVRTQVYPKH